MENTSKALIMAGEILIAILVLGLAVAIIMIMGNFSSNMNDRIAADKVAEFNQNFTKYEGRIDITAEEIATIINFAKHSNDDRELNYDDMGTPKQSVYWVNVNVDGIGNVFEQCGKNVYEDKYAFKKYLEDFIKANNGIYFCCNVEESFQKRPDVRKLPENGKKGVININLLEGTGNTEYSVATTNQTKMVTGIQFGTTKVKYKDSLFATMTPEEKQDKINEYAFTARNDARKLFTYIYNE